MEEGEGGRGRTRQETEKEEGGKRREEGGKLEIDRRGRRQRKKRWEKATREEGKEGSKGRQKLKEQEKG